MNTLTKCFQDAVAVDQLPVGESVTCQCGEVYKSTIEAPVMFGYFTNLKLVAGCQCDFASEFGNMLWQHRHPVSRFLRAMSEALEADRARLVNTLPSEVQLEVVR